MKMNSIPAKLNDLPELPFELIVSYLNLEDQIRSRAVSRKWRKMIDCFRPKSFCFSNRPSDFIYRKNRWINGAFVQNFISSSRHGPFFQAFGQSILSSLKHLRLCELDLNPEGVAAVRTCINSFDQLKELGLFCIQRLDYFQLRAEFELSLPMLESIHIEDVSVFKKLTLDAPRLQNVKLVKSPKMELVHNESVEKLSINRMGWIEVNKLKNLKFLYTNSSFNSTLLSSLKQLKEIHMERSDSIRHLFERKKECGLSNLKIFLFGFYLKNTTDGTIEIFDVCPQHFWYILDDQPTLAEEIPFCKSVDYLSDDRIALELEIDFLKRCTDLESIKVYSPVQDVDRFLKLLKNLNNIVELEFCDQLQQELFDRLPDHCAIQKLKIGSAPEDLNFLFKLKSLITLELQFPIDIKIVLRVLEDLPFLLLFDLQCLKKSFLIEIDLSKQCTVLQRGSGEKTTVSDVNAVVQWISKKSQQE